MGRATWPRSDAARQWPKSCAADPGAGSCPWGGMSRSAAPVSSRARLLGGVDGFDDDEAKSKCDEGSEVLVRLLAAERHPLEALQLAHKLLDAGTSPIERLRKEC